MPFHILLSRKSKLREHPRYDTVNLRQINVFAKIGGIKMTFEKATFAGGCFWCMVKPFDQLPGIIKVVSGYAGGHVENPSYKEVKTGQTGHYEVVEITFDPTLFSYQSLLDLYWPQIDPTDPEGQFFDRGSQYRTAIFYHNDAQRELAEASKQRIEASGRFSRPIVTQILPAAPFYEAEEEHQDFYRKNPEKYAQERVESGRDSFIQSNWKN
jgi:peptide-methionine (S)-S-oxide reductase